MHCRSEWSKLPLLLNWGPWKRESKSTLSEQNGRSQRASLYSTGGPLSISLTFFLSLLPSSTKQTKRTDSPNPSLFTRKKWKMRSWEEKNEWWGNMRESRPDQLVLLKGWPHFINKHSLFFFGERDQILLVLLFFRTLTSL